MSPFYFLTRSFPDYRVMISIITLSGKTTKADIIIYNTATISVIQKEPAGDRFGGKPERCDYAPLANNTYSLTAFTCWPPSDGGISAHREVGPLSIFALHPVRVIL